nr:PLP-dependent aminotransferase family protein [Hymenobacter terricola]
MPYQTIIPLDRALDQPLYQQVATGLAAEIRRGIIAVGTRLPGSRVLAERLGLNRQTIIAAYDELVAQGWLESRPRQGLFVAPRLPQQVPAAPVALPAYPVHPAFAFEPVPTVATQVLPALPVLVFNDGFPDVRLAPLDVLTRAYRAIARRPSSRQYLRYGSPQGSAHLREALAADLRDTRGLAITAENILITRGSQQSIFLTAHVLLRPGDAVIVGETNYFAATATFQHHGGRLLAVPVDAHGLDVDAVERLCQQQPVRLLYVTPHHHHPTTVTLRADRRLKLLRLAAEYGFAILEDDYDFDFHYTGSPILPLASADTAGSVIYVGSLGKTLMPALRVGYLVAPSALVQAVTNVRRLIDRQGDQVLEEALAELYQSGEMSRHLRRAQRVYEGRRDRLCTLLREQLPTALHFEQPSGGMAVWARFASEINLNALSQKCLRNGLYLNDGSLYEWQKPNQNATRLGFASLNDTELHEAVAILAHSLQSLW